MSQQRTLPTARDLAYMHDAQAHLLRARIGVEDREAFNRHVEDYEAELGLPTADEIEVFLSFTNLIDLGPIGAVRAFGMLIAGLLTGQFEKAVEAGWNPDECREEVERTFTKENLEKERKRAEEAMGGLPPGLGGIAAALGLDPSALGLVDAEPLEDLDADDEDVADEDSEPDVK